MKIMTGVGNRGVTLVELLVVIAIICILAVSLGFSYQGWIANYKIESQIKQLYSDLIEARARALTRSFPYLVAMTSADYTIAEDADGNGTINAGDTSLWGVWQPKTLQGGYQFKMFSADPFPTADSPLTIDTRGYTNVGAVTEYVGIDSTGFNPDYDCIIVTQARIRMGKWNGGTSCDEK
jgi:prepilin-type N-terminal cleavage/methylation domain-containing protein